MSESQSTYPPPHGVPVHPHGGVPVGLTVFAAFILIAAGLFQVVVGITDFARSAALPGATDYWAAFSPNVWGTIHVLIGLAVIVVGFGLITGGLWARTAALVFAMISGLVNFLYIPLVPVWSVVIILLDVLVVYAVTSHPLDVHIDPTFD